MIQPRSLYYYHCRQKSNLTIPKKEKMFLPDWDETLGTLRWYLTGGDTLFTAESILLFSPLNWSLIIQGVLMEITVCPWELWDSIPHSLPSALKAVLITQLNWTIVLNCEEKRTHIISLTFFGRFLSFSFHNALISHVYDLSIDHGRTFKCTLMHETRTYSTRYEGEDTSPKTSQGNRKGCCISWNMSIVPG